MTTQPGQQAPGSADDAIEMYRQIIPDMANKSLNAGKGFSVTTIIAGYGPPQAGLALVNAVRSALQRLSLDIDGERTFVPISTISGYQLIVTERFTDDTAALGWYEKVAPCLYQEGVFDLQVVFLGGGFIGTEDRVE